jgi:DNA-directed RNA polymerase sigma subunit (sigma70/sigma32)
MAEKPKFRYSLGWPTEVSSWSDDPQIAADDLSPAPNGQVESNTGEDKTLANKTEALISLLTPRQRTVIELLHGVGDNPWPLSPAQVGRILNISRQAVQRCETRALRNMRRNAPPEIR